jgi:hypothetical protein
MITIQRLKPIFLLVAILVIVSIACGSSSEVATQPEPPSEQSSQNQSEDQPESTITKEIQPTKTVKPTNSPTPMPIGLSRLNPFPLSDLIVVPNWNIQVLEIKRGEEAWIDLSSANMLNSPPPESMEYLLLNISVESTHTDSEEHSIGGCDFDVTGDLFINYTCTSAFIVEPDPQLDATLYSGGKTEGWVGFLVGVAEGNLVLVFDEIFNFDGDSKRFIALDAGASLEIPKELSSIKPGDIGKEMNNPALLSEKIVTEEWEISILEVVYGDEALNMVMEANQFNDPPEDGMEYIIVNIYARNISSTEDSNNIDWTYFNITGNANIKYEHPSIVSPEPRLNIDLYPGGVTEGWIVLQAGIDEENLIIIFDPIFDFSGKNKRFISLE